MTVMYLVSAFLRKELVYMMAYDEDTELTRPLSPKTAIEEDKKMSEEMADLLKPKGK